MEWMLITQLNFIFYSCNFKASLITSMISIVALLEAIYFTDFNFWAVGIVTVIWLVITLSVLEFLQNYFSGCILEYILDNKGAELLIDNLKEGVIILDDAEKVVLFAN